tara:strand:- start:1804 stop:2415 length:612 start_codon:yes stop_codon:yes gene_type:complete
MACTVYLGDINFSCTELPVGGLTKVWIGDKAALMSGASPAVSVDVRKEIDDPSNPGTNIQNTAYGAVSINPTGATLLVDQLVHQLSFNNKDGYSVFTDVKTVNADGSVSTVPTITVEFPVMSASKRNTLEQIAVGGAELVAFVETAAGTHHLVGAEYGLYAGSIDGNSGTVRSDKNRFQLLLTGEEQSLAFGMSATVFAEVAG